MSTVTKRRVTAHESASAKWLPLALAPVAVGLAGAAWPAWSLMWGLAASIYVGLKWLTLVDCADAWPRAPQRAMGYLLLWPGLDAKSFLASSRRVPSPPWNEWLFAVAKLAFGAFLFGVVAPVASYDRVLAGWIGVAGVLFVLHFGLFHLLSLLWRSAGVDAVAIMNVPIAAASLGDFWGRRWNLAFRDVAHVHVFRPLASRYGAAGATMAVFLASGVVHDLVISIPAGAGFGLPTLYFAIQGLGLLFERSRVGRRLGLGRGVGGRLFCALVTVAPIGLLFHPVFLERVIVPMLTASSM